MLILVNQDVNILVKKYKWMLAFILGLVGFKTTLHAAIDDSTGNLVGLYFDQQETLNGYYNVTKQILMKYGIPYKFKTDKKNGI